MNRHTINCSGECCKLVYNTPYIFMKRTGTKPRLGKSGVFIYDPITNRILLVQSCGKLWGFPKGSIEFGETNEQTSIREVYEETGIRIPSLEGCQSIKVYNNLYYILELSEVDVSIPNIGPHNDASGVGWIKISCLIDLVRNKRLKMNSHFKILLKKLLSIDINLQVNTTV